MTYDRCPHRYAGKRQDCPMCHLESLHLEARQEGKGLRDRVKELEEKNKNLRSNIGVYARSMSEANQRAGKLEEENKRLKAELKSWEGEGYDMD